MQQIKSREFGLSEKHMNFFQDNLRALMHADTRDDFDKKLKTMKSSSVWRSRNKGVQKAVAYFDLNWLKEDDIRKWAKYARHGYYKKMDTTNASEAWNQLRVLSIIHSTNYCRIV